MSTRRRSAISSCALLIRAEDAVDQSSYPRKSENAIPPGDTGSEYSSLVASGFGLAREARPRRRESARRWLLALSPHFGKASDMRHGRWCGFGFLVLVLKSDLPFNIYFLYRKFHADRT